MKKTLLIIFALAALMVSCTKENGNTKFEKEEEIFTATLSDDITVKTSLNSTTKQVTWDLDDVIKINEKEFRALSSGTSSQFTGRESSTVSAPYYAFYPSTIAGNQNICVLPSTQTYSEGKATNLPMYAYSESDKDLNFKNICGVLKIKAPAGNYLRTITVSSTNKALCGSFEVIEVDGNFVAKYRRVGNYDADKSITLNITGDSVSEALIAIPANNTDSQTINTYDNLTIYVTNTEGLTFSRTVKNLFIAANHIKTISFAPPTDAFYIEAVETGKIEFIKEVNAKDNAISLEYSTDGCYWKPFYNNTSSSIIYNPITTEAGKKYYFRAPEGRDNPSFGNIEKATWSSIVYKFVTSGNVKVGGNILYLLNNTGNAQMDALAFSHIFYQTSVTDASALILPSNQIASRCYEGLLEKCYNLIAAPTIPDINPAEYCYQFMFSDCTSLVNPPDLPSTEVAEGCYNSMFQGCTSLTTTPVLKATKLEKMCYNCIFTNCKSINSVTMLATDISAEKSLSSWLAGTEPTSGETKNLFVDSSMMNSYSLDQYRYGWTLTEYVAPAPDPQQ